MKKYLILGAIIGLALVLIFTLVYIYPPEDERVCQIFSERQR